MVVLQFGLCETEYCVHFDSDMLLMAGSTTPPSTTTALATTQHTKPRSLVGSYSWVAEGVSVLSRSPDVLVFCPLSGPPFYADGKPTPGQFKSNWLHDARGFFSVPQFSARAYMWKRSTLDLAVPLNPMQGPGNDLEQVLSRLVVNSLSATAPADLRRRRFVRADSYHGTNRADGAFVLHASECQCSAPELKAIIDCMERGIIPSGQLGIAGLRPFSEWQAAGCRLS